MPSSLRFARSRGGGNPRSCRFDRKGKKGKDLVVKKEKHSHAEKEADGPEVEVEIPLSLVPKKVIAAVKKKVPGIKLTEAEIVSSADKRVVHDQIVDLDKRFEYLMDTYGHHPEALEYFDEMRRRMEHIEQLIKAATGRPIPAFS